MNKTKALKQALMQYAQEQIKYNSGGEYVLTSQESMEKAVKIIERIYKQYE